MYYRKKSQALLTVIFLLTLVTVLIAGLTSAWHGETRRHLDMRDSMLSFYLAQAGLERAKLELTNNWNWSGVSPAVLLGQGSYRVSVNAVNPTVRRVIAVGLVRNCEKQVSADIVQTGAAPAIIYVQGQWSWREL